MSVHASLAVCDRNSRTDQNAKPAGTMNAHIPSICTSASATCDPNKPHRLDTFILEVATLKDGSRGSYEARHKTRKRAAARTITAKKSLLCELKGDSEVSGTILNRSCLSVLFLAIYENVGLYRVVYVNL